MRKTHLMVLAIVVAAVVLAVGAVTAFADISSDSEKPVSTTNAAASYWDAAAITVTATDNEGIRYIYHKLDDQAVRLDIVSDSPAQKSVELAVPTANDHALASGSHTLKFWAQDVNGNVEAQQAVEFTIVMDTARPRTSATSVSVRRGRRATLKYKVAEAEPTKGTATVSIKIKNSHGKVVKTIKAGSKTVNTALTAKFRCRFAKGTYKYYVYATDASGNVQAKVGWARLRVK